MRWESVIIALLRHRRSGSSSASPSERRSCARSATLGFTGFVIPFGQLVVVAILAALAGVVAAILPARKAAKLDILSSIATE